MTAVLDSYPTGDLALGGCIKKLVRVKVTNLERLVREPASWALVNVASSVSDI